MNGCLIESIKEERGRLVKKRSTLEIERCTVLSKTETAQFLPLELKQKVRWSYNSTLANLNEQILDMDKHIKLLKGAEKNG